MEFTETLKKMWEFDSHDAWFAIERYEICNKISQTDDMTIGNFRQIDNDMRKIAVHVGHAAHAKGKDFDAMDLSDEEIWDSVPEELLSIYTTSKERSLDSFARLAKAAYKAMKHPGNGEHEEYRLYKEGTKVFPKEKQGLWAEMVITRCFDLYQGKDADAVLRIQKCLMADDIEGADKIMSKMSGSSASIVLSMVRDICSNADKFLSHYIN